MAIKVSRTHGLRVLMEKCGCKATREFEDVQLTKPLGDVPTFIACAKHTESGGTDVIQEILCEMLETAAMQAAKMPTPVIPNESLGHSVNDVAAAAAAGGESATRTPIRKLGATSGRTAVRRAGAGGALPRVSAAVMESRAVGGGASIDAELARDPSANATPMRVGPVNRQAVQDALDEAAETGDEITPLDVLLGVNDPTERG